jgi:hypothetical protein
MANQSLLDVVTKDFARDASKEGKGAWMVYGKLRYLIARAHRNNVAFQKAMEEEMRPYQWAIERGSLDAIKEVTQHIMHKVYAETVLLAIERLPNADGTSGERLDYTPADGIELFTKLPDFWDAVFKFADTGRNYARAESYSPEAVKDDSGN